MAFEQSVVVPMVRPADYPVNEFLPTRDPIEALAEAFRICNVSKK